MDVTCSGPTPIARRPVAMLAGVFFFSGITSLIYQVAWQRLLSLHYGVGTVSITLIVSVYMLGLGFGSLLGGRLAERSSDPFALYAAVEFALGAAGLASFPLILILGRISAGPTPAVAPACLFAFLSLLTLLMGITLPLLAAIFSRLTGAFLASVSRLYFLNTLGAAIGAILTSYLLVPFIGLDGSVYAAAAVNLCLAALILGARKSGRSAMAAELPANSTGAATGLGRLAYLLVFAGGFVAIGYEIIWYRVIGVLVKDSPYAFSSVLAVYLFGIALGSRTIRGYLAAHPNASRKDLYFILQFLIGFAVLGTFAAYYHLSQHSLLQRLTRLSFTTDTHPSLALLAGVAGIHGFDRAFLLLDVFLWPLAFMLVPTMFMGASFPLIASLALSHSGGEGPAVFLAGIGQ